ncbi:MAG: undecaprenyl-diphosphate phosphatase [Solirubrobacterales bacterium]|nr:undecaprenyl-diphosphate phosphatase [Solirubrobacterales bacterium]
MDAFQAIVLGAVQGLTEFLPISSSGHLRIVPAFAGWEDPGAAFTAVIQIGTMAAVLLYFRKDLWNIFSTWLRSLREPDLRPTLNARLGWYIILGTIPISIFGVLFSDQIENGARDLYLIGTTLIVFAFFLLAAERTGAQDRGVESLTRRDGIIIGCAQALALIPGVSRSGSTMTAGMFLGLERAAAARYSFLLWVPAVVLSGLYELKDIGGDGSAPVGATVIATVLAFITGYAAIAWMLKFLATNTVAVFVIYRVLVGAGVLFAVATGTIS